MVTYRVLGATEVLSDGALVDLGGPLPRRLLTILLAAEGRSVRDEQLSAAVWGDGAPSRASASLQAYVSRLRRALGGAEVLQRRGDGYVISATTDAGEFVKEVEQGCKLLAEGHAARAIAVLTEALGRWRGEPFADLADFDGVAAARVRLEELRETAIEERAAARLAYGDVASAVADIDAAISENPYRERRWALLILGLYRAGRQRDALAALRRVRRLLADDLGIDPGPELQDLERQVLAQDPELLAARPVPKQVAAGNEMLSSPLSSFLGREKELAATAEVLANSRLLTMVGPAGVGKTRLAVEHSLSRRDEDGPWLVRLADIHQPELVTESTARAVGASDRQELIGILRTRPGLLVLDNCEHLVEPVATMVLDLLRECPGLRILITSREPLGIDGELLLPVDPLSAVGDDAPALALLLGRIRTVRPGWQPSPEELAQAGQLAIALDGLPLALELAAARARVLDIGDILDRLDDRFALLGAVPRGSLTPHATLREAIAWSIDQLPADDFALLLWLWPFEGGFSLEAIEALGTRAVESLSSLVTRSVVTVDTTTRPARYRLLETIRAYCQERDPRPDQTREAHAAWAYDLVEQRAGELVSRQGAHAMKVLIRELPNLHAAIAHDLEREPVRALRTMGLLDWFWTRVGQFAERLGLLDAALDAAPDAPPVDRARAYVASGSLAGTSGDLAGAQRRFAAAIELVGHLTGRDERVIHTKALYYSAMTDLLEGKPDRAEAKAERGIAIAQDLSIEWLEACVQMTLGATLVQLGRYVEGEATLLSATAQAERAGLLWSAAWSESTRALSMLKRATGAPAIATEALIALRRGLAWFQREGDTTRSLAVLMAGADALLLADRPRDAVRLQAAIRHHVARLGRQLPPGQFFRRGLGIVVPGIEPDLEPAERDAAETEGAALDWAATLDLLE